MTPPAPRPLLPVIIGTAGHIDHGKSSLVKALTGRDPDRLKEEQERGITIELGFAFLDDRIAFIDVPGHERFVRHMVAGAATIDYALLTVAADDGVMPQTREHLDILGLLGVRGGLVVLTKADLVDEEMMGLVRDEVAELLVGSALEGAGILEADSLSGRGIPEVRRAIEELAAAKRVQGGSALFRLPVDRVFTLKGIGTVVTGSVLSGTAAPGDRLELLPSGREVRVKSLQSHDRSVDRVMAGQRAAVNLAGVAVNEIERGCVLATPDRLRPANVIYARIFVLPSAGLPVSSHLRIHLHIGTAGHIGRIYPLEAGPVEPGGQGMAMVVLETPAVAQRLDRFIVRRYSPVRTLGGGIVLDTAPVRPRRLPPGLREHLARLESPDRAAVLLTAVERQPFCLPADLAAVVGIPAAEVQSLAGELARQGALHLFGTEPPRLCPALLLQTAAEVALAALDRYHAANPLRAGMPKNELVSRLRTGLPKGTAQPVIERLVELGLLAAPGGGIVARPDFTVTLDPERVRALHAVAARLEDAGMTPPSAAELAAGLGFEPRLLQQLLTYLVDTDRAVCIDGQFFFAAPAMAATRETLKRLFAEGGTPTASEIREALSSTRKYIIPLLEHFDAIGWTRREGDVRHRGPAL